MIRNTVAATLLAIFTIGCGGGGPSPKEACEELVKVVCSKIYECFSEEERAAAGFPATEAGCVTELNADAGCASQTEENTCDAGETYNASKADDCIDQFSALTCQQLISGGDDVAPACDQVCEA
jgi:hypothetical protein